MYSTPNIVMYYLLHCAPCFWLRIQKNTFGPSERFIMSLPSAWSSTYGQYADLKETVPEYFVLIM